MPKTKPDVEAIMRPYLANIPDRFLDRRIENLQNQIAQLQTEKQYYIDERNRRNAEAPC